MAAVEQIAAQLGYKTQVQKEELLVQGKVGMRFVNGAAAVWLGYDVISLPARTRMADGHWWVESKMALKLYSQFLKRNGKNVTLSWSGAAGKSTPSVSKSEKKATPQPAPKAEEKKKTSPPQGNSGLPTVKGLRWGGESPTIRAVLDLEGRGEPQSISDDDSLTVKVARIAPAVLSRLRLKHNGIAVDVQNGDPAELRFTFTDRTAHSFVLQGPHRFVIDFKPAPHKSVKPAPASAPEPKPRVEQNVQKKVDPKVEKKTPSKPAAEPVRETSAPPAIKGKKLVVIDAGHGGKDPGALAHGYREKVIALQIATKLANVLRSRGVNVRMTRTGDTYPTLKERTAMANNWNADVFVSIHLNALPKGKHSSGIEIYLMALPTDKDAMTLAKIENAEIAENGTKSSAASDKQTEMLLSILGNMQQNAKIGESTVLAEALFHAGQDAKLNMKRVAQAPFWVLRGAGMPSVLIETGFITELSEARRLSQSAYQQKMAEAFATGIINFIK